MRWLFHATAFVDRGSYESTRDALSTLAGLTVLEDTAHDDPSVGRRGGLTWLGDNSLELGEPFGAGGPVQAFLDRFGPGVHSVGVQVSDLDATAAHLTQLGIRIAARNDEFAFIFCDPRDTEGLLLQFAAVEMPFDPRFGGEIPAGPEPLLPVERLAWIEATVPDPSASAIRLAEIIGTAVTFDDGHRAGVSLGDNTLLLRAGERARWTGLTLEVPSVSDAHHHLLAAANLPLQITLTDALLPGDPRLSRPDAGPGS